MSLKENRHGTKYAAAFCEKIKTIYDPERPEIPETLWTEGFHQPPSREDGAVRGALWPLVHAA